MLHNWKTKNDDDYATSVNMFLFLCLDEKSLVDLFACASKCMWGCLSWQRGTPLTVPHMSLSRAVFPSRETMILHIGAVVPLSSSAFIPTLQDTSRPRLMANMDESLQTRLV
jgi:hypothetical protein